MKKTHILCPMLVATSTLAVPLNTTREDSFVNHLTASARFGMNIGVKFGPRVTADGGLYNFIDGYVLENAGGNYNPDDPSRPVTQYFGYDNYPRQVDINNSNLLLTQAAGGGGSPAHAMDDCPQAGAEISYTHELGQIGEKGRYGFEVALNFMNLCLSDNSSVSGTGQQTPFGIASSPNTFSQQDVGYGGRYELVQGDVVPLVYATPGISSPVNFTIAGRHQFDADIWGLRVGPYLSHPLGKHVEVNLVGGFAAVLVDASASWEEAVTIGTGAADPARSGSGGGCDVLWGYYVGLNLSWHISKRWDLNAGVQFQDVGIYNQNVGSRAVELDMSQALFVTVGVSYKF